MQRKVSAALSLLLSFIMLFLPVIPVCTAFAESACACENTPIIYIRGMVDIVKHDPIKGDYTVFDDADYVSQILETCIPSFAKGVLTNDWDEYCEKVLDILLPAFDGFAPNLDGSIPAESADPWAWKASDISAEHNAATTYVYRIDSRRSPLDLADDLNTFIETVKAKTGHDKVILYARSMGPTLLYAYLAKYQRPVEYAGVERVLLTMSTAPSSSYAEAAFGGTAHIDAESADRYLTQNMSVLQEALGQETMEKLNGAVEMLQTHYGISITSELLNRLYQQLKDKLIAKFIKAYYGLHLGFLACIDQNLDQALDYIFAEEGDDVKYRYFIEKAKAYHENVQKNVIPMLQEIKAQGKDVYVLADYGYQQVPIGADTNLIGDKTVGVKQQSFGATCATVDGTLEASYIAKRTEAGFGKYLSPDKKIDSSTALFPDSTWFVNNNNHNWPDQLINFEMKLLRESNATIDSFDDYPQFLNYDPDAASLVPAQETNANDVNWNQQSKKSFLQSIRDFFEKIINFFKSLFQSIHTGCLFLNASC